MPAIAANNVGELEARGRTQVFFALGSAALTEGGRQSLRAIAAQAEQITGYRLAIVGRDPTGNPAANRRLSERRVATVTDFLLQECGVLLLLLRPRG